MHLRVMVPPGQHEDLFLENSGLFLTPMAAQEAFLQVGAHGSWVLTLFDPLNTSGSRRQDLDPGILEKQSY